MSITPYTERDSGISSRSTEYRVQSTLYSIRLLRRRELFKNIAIDMSDTVSVDQL